MPGYVWLDISEPQQGSNRVKSHGVARARAPEAPERPAEKEQLARQPNTLQLAAFCGRGRARATRPKNNVEKSKDRAAHEPATAEAKQIKHQPNALHSIF